MTAEQYLLDNIEEVFGKHGDTSQFEEVAEAMKEYARMKCQELLLLVAEKVRIIEDGDINNPYEEYFLDLGGSLRVDKDSILNAVDLEKFCGGTPSS